MIGVNFFIDACWIFFDSCYGTTTVACCKVDTRWKQRQGNGVGRAFPETEWPTLSVPDFYSLYRKGERPMHKETGKSVSMAIGNAGMAAVLGAWEISP